MDTKSGYPFWVILNGLLAAYPRLERDARCDVLVIGGGITGALIADHLSRHDYDVIVVERRDIGWGSTAASTALIQYECDEMMIDLAKRFDETRAALVYRACVSATEQLSSVARGLGDVGFQRCDSVYLAPSKRDVKLLDEEAALRATYAIPSTRWTAAKLRTRYGITASGALHTHVAAVIDPYRFTHRLLARSKRRGVRIFDRTTIASTEVTARGVVARTEHGSTIRAGHVIVAAGYETQAWLDQRVASNRSSYACISDPLSPKEIAPIANTVFWETARPYHYVRTTTDHRLLVGGEDDRMDNAAKRDRRVDKRANSLRAYAMQLFPHLDFVPAFAWAGTFAETRDGLPYFGAHAQHGPRILFAMAYGGNGITYSLLGATLLRALIEKREHPLATAFAFTR